MSRLVDVLHPTFAVGAAIAANNEGLELGQQKEGIQRVCTLDDNSREWDTPIIRGGSQQRASNDMIMDLCLGQHKSAVVDAIGSDLVQGS